MYDLAVVSVFTPMQQMAKNNAAKTSSIGRRKERNVNKVNIMCGLHLNLSFVHQRMIIQWSDKNIQL